MNNQQQPQTIRAASEKQTAFIAALFQSIDWKAVTMQEASATIRALLKVRDAHKPAKPAKEKKAGKKKASKEKETTTTNTSDGKAIKAKTITNDVKPAPEAPKASETASAEIAESKPAEASKTAKKAKIPAGKILLAMKYGAVLADQLQDLGNGLYFVRLNEGSENDRKYIYSVTDKKTGFTVYRRDQEQKRKCLEGFKTNESEILKALARVRKEPRYKKLAAALKVLPVMTSQEYQKLAEQRQRA